MNQYQNAQSCLTVPSTLFELGEIVISPDLQYRLSLGEVLTLLHAYAAGDWDATHPEMAAANDKAIQDGGQIHAFYRKADGNLLFISTVRGEHSLTSMIAVDSERP